jgi:hypothetical protein
MPQHTAAKRTMLERASWGEQDEVSKVVKVPSSRHFGQNWTCGNTNLNICKAVRRHLHMWSLPESVVIRKVHNTHKYLRLIHQSRLTARLPLLSLPPLGTYRSDSLRSSLYLSRSRLRSRRVVSLEAPPPGTYLSIPAGLRLRSRRVGASR